ncbi:pyridoxal phosphate-dependent transferase [Rhodofomes roseus]|uniref:sphinganine-1-phosphate aldolase n=1 Tax=Rhodofomes roseus TaxID=34475 RepID=A0ABQ8KLI6_9APHY|nr:pyridoxal phosphate-dependent transferase [Rhodofomes roseus]KAH9839172.1 pyridoxal phosphate-dependent transferase [Rhodofomes roseus]
MPGPVARRTRLSAVVNSSAYELLKDAIVVYLVVTRTLKVFRHLRARGVTETVVDFWKWISQEALLLALRLPSMRKRVSAELGKATLDLEKGMVPEGPSVHRHLALPMTGQSPEWIVTEMEAMDHEAPGEHADWREGKVSGAVYHGGEELTRVILAAIERYALSNPLHPDVFPAVRKMEAEVVAMCLAMYNNPTGAGTTTSGGTESIVMACKTYRDWARAVKGIREPEMVVPATAHAAFDKGGAYLGIKVHTIPVDPETRQVNLKRVKRAINANTIMLVGSAINFPDGNADDIVALGNLAAKHNIGLHVDCCLGSFIVPFIEEAGLGPFAPFDFRVRGVTSISCDTHKYGFAPKGSSVIMYRDAELRKHQYYVNPDWVGGVYASPSIAGSRPGALIAGSWAAMHYMGRQGYLDSCKSIVSAARTIASRIRAEIPELRILGEPRASVVAFASARKGKAEGVSVLEVGDKMAKKGWHLNALSGPAALHIAVTRLTVPVVDQFIADLKDAVREAQLSPSGQGTMVRLYGIGSGSPVGSTMVGHLATAFLDTLYKA